MLEAKFDFDHNKHTTNSDTRELGWKLFILKLADIIATLTVKLAWLAALLWAFQTMLNNHH